MNKEIERKWLVHINENDRHSLSNSDKVRLLGIEQVYVKPPSSGEVARVRKTANLATKEIDYVYTCKKAVSSGVNLEVNKIIDDEVYQYFCDLEKLITHDKLIKLRYEFEFKDHKFQLDWFIEKDFYLLEIEFNDESKLDENIDFPVFLQVFREVTGDPSYSNYNIASKQFTLKGKQ